MYGKTTIAHQLRRWMTSHSQGNTRALLSVFGSFALGLILVTLLLSLLAVVAGANSSNLPVLHPAPNTHSAPITTSIVISFSTDIDPATISTHTISIHSAQQGLLSGTYTVDNAQVQMTPSRPFFPGELVQGVVTTHTRSITGTATTIPIVWQFRTAVDSNSGYFEERQSGLDSTWSEDIALGDLDGDGDLDIFLGHRDDASTVWFNDGAGQFTTNGIDLGTAFIINVSLSDLDGDKDLDVILAGIQDNILLWNDGQGGFSYGGEIFADSYIIRNLELGDLDGDGDLDAVTISACDPFDPDPNCTYATNRIWLNDGAGGFLPSTQSLGSGTSADASLGDLDGDGDLDAMVVRPGQAGSVWTNLGNGVFTSALSLDSLSAESVDFGDLDGDGDLDAFVASQSIASSSVWLNVGSGILTPGQHLGAIGPATLGDLDGDGDLDAFSVNDGADKVWFNQGDATFVFSGQNLGTMTSTGVAIGDLDGDSDLDVVTSGYNTEPRMWTNHPRTDQLPPRVWLPLVIR